VEDADGDSVPDCADDCPEDFNKLVPGICGCGVPDQLLSSSAYGGLPICQNGELPNLPGKDSFTSNIINSARPSHAGNTLFLVCVPAAVAVWTMAF
jgi:hypothetical protein